MRFWLSIAHFKGNYSVITPPSVQIIIRKLCNLLYMPIIDINKPKGQALFAEYVDRGVVPMAFEVCWKTDGPEVKDCLAKIKGMRSKIWESALCRLTARKCLYITSAPSEGTIKVYYFRLSGNEYAAPRRTWWKGQSTKPT